MRVTGLKKICALALAVVLILSTFSIAVSATSQSGSNNTFGNWRCSTFYSGGYYYTTISSSKPCRLYVESVYQKYPSGVKYATQKLDTNGYNCTYAEIYLSKQQQTTIWSYHNWKTSSGSGMSKYTQLINA